MGVDYQRKRYGGIAVGGAEERQCNSSGAQSNPYLSAILIKKTLDDSVFFRIWRKCGLCGRLTLLK